MKNPERWFPLVLAGLGFAIIAPVLWSDWLGDDAFYSLLRGALIARHVSLMHAIVQAFTLWLFANGRFYPGHILEKYLVFYVFTGLVAYKAFLVAATLLTVEVFRRCVAGYTTTAIANLSGLVVVALFTLRGYHDPILSYNAGPQAVAMLMLLSLMAFRRALVQPGWIAYAGSVALYAAAVLSYEDAYLLCVLFPLVARTQRVPGRDAIRLAVPYAAVAGALIALSLVMRRLVQLPNASGYAFGADPHRIAVTALQQIVAAFPLTYWGFDPSRIYSRSDLGDFLRNAPLSPAVFLAFAAAAWWCLSRLPRDGKYAAGLAWIGAAVVVLPALPIAATLKYQRELTWGLGYLPVFVEYFGVALLACAVTLIAARRFSPARVRGAACVTLGLIAAMTQATNVRLVREGVTSRAARAALEGQLRGGLLANVRNGQAIAMARDFDWIAYDDDGPDGIATRFMFTQYAGRNLMLVPPGDAAARILLNYDRSRDRWSLQRR